ncbi:MAG: HlyD family efflux transporter periplasmic adaptor subunit [Gemmataceae bacterium]
MKRLPLRLFGCALLAGLIGFTARAQDTPPKTEKTEKTEKSERKLATTKAERSPMKSETSFKGMFEASDMTEVSVKLEAWGGMTVQKAVEAGTKVKAGDVLVEFDTEKIDKALKDSEVDQRLGELALKLADFEVQLAGKANNLEFDSAERSFNNSREDYKKYMEVDKPHLIESVEFSLKASKSHLENQEEELKQLEKMYRSKDLTEETEQIVLKRTRFAVEQAKFSLKSAQLRHDQVLNIDLPRRDKELKDGQERAEINWTKAKETIPLSLEQKKLGLDKAKQERVRSREKYENLKKDRLLFTAKAPTDGIVYYGKCVQGNWTGSATKLQKGGTVSSEEVFMTIVKPGDLFVRGSVDEKDCRLLEAGQTCKLTVPAYPDAKITGVVEKVATVPIAGSYEVRVKVKHPDVNVIPGMTCQVKVMTFEKKDALTVPSFAVFTDEGEDDKPYVYRTSASGKPQKTSVKLGKKTGGKVEIVDGLKEGDEILRDKPSTEKSAEKNAASTEKSSEK